MAVLQVGKDVFGVANQEALGTPEAQPQFAHGLAGGGVKVAVNQEVDPLTSAYISPAGALRDKVDAGAEITARAWKGSAGLYLLGALGHDTPSQLPAPSAITSSSVANPTVITTTAPHGQGSSGTKQVTIAGHTGSTPAVSGAYTATMTGASTFTVPVNVTVGGTGGTVTFPATSYTHTLTLGEATPYLTAFELKGDDTIVIVQDCKVDELALSWDGNKPVELSTKLIGTVLSFGAAAWTPVNNEMDTTTYFTPSGGIFEIDVDGSTLVSATVVAGSVTIKRATEAQFYSGDIEAGDVAEGFCEPEVSLTIVPEDLAEWRTIITGTPAGTTVGSVPVYGSFSLQFACGSNTLTLSAAKVAFMCELVDADPAGGAAKLELAGVCYRSGATPVTAVLTNLIASYNPVA